mmetsp:Transcript_31469/g.68796  ORF Transcript_31469/g.68796 Transcript_31469/m.68796 type:complete len:259 (+) Transcript_31469:753-1529(+)
MARILFFSCERSSVQKTRMPVGLWIRSIAVSTLFTFCPPAPPDRAVVISMSFGSTWTSTSSTSGITATVAVEVCTRPPLSVAGTRCTRCTPASHFSFEYTLNPVTSMITSLYPPMSASAEDAMDTFHPSFSAKREYMRIRSPHQIPASSPPVPARTSSMMLRSSRGSLGSSRRVSCSSSVASSWLSSFCSSLIISSISGSPEASPIISFPSASACTVSWYRSNVSMVSVSAALSREILVYAFASAATSGSASCIVSCL